MTQKPGIILPDKKIVGIKPAAEKKEDTPPALDRIPKPTGWRLIVLPYKGVGKTKGGVLLTDKAVEEQQIASVCALVLEVGDLAYKDTEKFPNGAWCKKGDWVIIARYAGSRIKIEGGELRILNDDEILGTIKSPEDILGVYT